MSSRHHAPRHPPWWPHDEPWPPSGPPGMRAWRAMRGRFFWRVAGLFAVMFVFSVGGCTLLSWLAASLLGLVDLPLAAGAAPALGRAIAALILAAIGLLVAGRALRHMALPIGDLMEAAGRVADGDYSARAAERGPREVRALAHAFNSMAARLQMNEEQRRNFIADVIHELRTPLTVVQGTLEGLLDGVYPRDDERLGAILDETRVLSRLIDDLRTLALAETGALKLQKEPTDLSALLAKTAASFRAQADAAGVGLSVETEADLPLLEIDPERIREVLGNLIANALRYTPDGGKIRVRSAAEGGGGGPITCSVADTGAGIPPDDLPHVFDRFYRTRDSRGMGLGLAIAKNLVAAHGGEMLALSEPGQGTTIRFSLPS